MCGIGGIVDKDGVDTGELEKISGLLSHRGPDDEGFCAVTDEDEIQSFSGKDTAAELKKNLQPLSKLNIASVAFVHRRLSVIDLSSKGHQPMLSPSGKAMITYNGEIYNYKELKEELIKEGCEFQSKTDTEVVLKAYQKWGMRAFDRFVGMWALGILDLEKNKLILSRDRFGIKPLYYSSLKGKLAFSSEIKPLLELKGVSRNVDSRTLLEYISYGTTSKPFQNLFSDIKDLPPGHHLIIDLSSGAIEKNQYYDLKERSKLPLDNEKSFGELLRNSMRLHLRSDVEVGSCLSGGLDSSALVNIMKKLNPDLSLHTFTASFPGLEEDETSYAKAVAESLGVHDHYTLPNAELMIEDMNKLLYMQELPLGSSSVFAQWEVMKCAGNHGMKVLIDGQGADESLGGYYNFAGLYILDLFKAFKWGKMYREYKYLKNNFTPDMGKAVLRAAYGYLPGILKRYYRGKTRIGMGLIDDKYKRELRKLKVPNRNGKSFKDHSLKSFDFGLYELLRYEDRNSMAFSIESRVPFLDHRLVEYIIKMPSGDKIKEGWTKFPLRRFLNKKLPQHVVWRKDKKGFVTPQAKWKEEVMNEIKTYLKNAEVPDLLNKKALMEFCEGKNDENVHLSEFWRIYSIVKWCEIFKVELR